jgi:hypothetical protein
VDISVEHDSNQVELRNGNKALAPSTAVVN